MKVGSLVECVDDKYQQQDDKIIFPILGETYTIRAIDFSEPVVVWLEEIVNPVKTYREGLYEAAFDIDSFRELQPPLDLSELLEEKVTA